MDVIVAINIIINISSSSIHFSGRFFLFLAVNRSFIIRTVQQMTPSGMPHIYNTEVSSSPTCPVTVTRTDEESLTPDNLNGRLADDSTPMTGSQSTCHRFPAKPTVSLSWTTILLVHTHNLFADCHPK